MDVFEYASAVPAPGCPHYITAAAAERGEITCTPCGEYPSPRYRGKRRAQGALARAAARNRAALAASADLEPGDVGLAILDGQDAA